MDLKTKFKTLSIVYRDNGLLAGTGFIIPFLSQLYLKFPSKHIYSYNVKMLNKKVKFLHQTNIFGPATLIDIFGWGTYFNSSHRKIVFQFDEKSKILDLGAFVGDTAVFFAMQGAKVYAYEPQKEACKMANENIALNKLQNKVNLVNAAVTSDGRELNFNDSNNKITGCFSATKENVSSNKVSSLSLSKVLKQEKKWDLVKIDIEGGEYELIKYFVEHEDLLKNIKGFAVEFEDIPCRKDEIDKFIEVLKKFDFKIDYSFGYLGMGMLYAKR